MTYQLAVDVGGTFTDLVLREPDGRVRSFKSPSSPGQIVEGILNGITLIAEYLGLERREFLRRCSRFSCGTTVATNAILEGTYARTGLIATEGFRDTLLIREGGKADADAITIAMDYPEPYIPRHLTFGVGERINSDGGIERPLDEASVIEVLARMKELGIESIAVALLWSIANPEHELRVGELIEQHLPGIPFSLSHTTSPTLREYRRTSATAIDASLKPLVKRAVSEMERRLREEGLEGLLTLVTSSGGQTAAPEVIARPIDLCLSGPSAAPEASRNMFALEEQKSCDAIVVDMGGTSFDISIINNWEIPMHREGVIAGHVFGVPSVEVKTIGSGGGSIARVDAGGFIHVGPESAKSVPGPACYGRGGERPTVTDANLIRGFLDPENFAGGTMKLSVENARKAIEQEVGQPLGLSAEEAASLVGVAVEQSMVAAIEEITIRRGVDPREYVMVVGGAAAGLHAVVIARELGMKRVFVPPIAGVLSAYGISVSSMKSSFSRSQAVATDAFDFDRVNATLSELEREGSAYLDRMNIPAERRTLQFSTEARYRGQVWQLTLDLESPRIRDQDDLAAVVENFHKLHDKLYYVRSNDPIEFTEWSVIATGELPDRKVNFGVMSDGDIAAARKSSRIVHMRELGGKAEVPVIDGTLLSPGITVKGPVLIDQPLTTIVLYPGSEATMTSNGGIWIDL